jgi:ATP-binding cassette subfamily F protein uup
MPAPLLALRGATVRIASQVLFEGVDVAVAKGDRVCLVGRNGSGKSTLLKALAGLVALDGGERFVQPRTSVAYLAQEPALPAAGTLRDYVMGGLPEAERAGAEYRADAALEALGLDPEREADGLVVRELDTGSGVVRVEGPGEASDVVMARTDREGDVVVAACFGERSPT